MFELQRKWEALGLVIPFFSSTATRTLGCFKISCESLRLVRGKIPTRWTADPDTIYEPQRRAGKSSQRHSSLVLSREHLSGMERRGFVTLDPWKACAMLTSSLIRPHALCLSFPFHYRVHPALSRLSPVVSTPSTSYCGLSDSTRDNSFSTLSKISSGNSNGRSDSDSDDRYHSHSVPVKPSAIRHRSSNRTTARLQHHLRHRRAGTTRQCQPTCCKVHKPLKSSSQRIRNADLKPR